MHRLLDVLRFEEHRQKHQRDVLSFRNYIVSYDKSIQQKNMILYSFYIPYSLVLVSRQSQYFFL